MSAGSTLWDFKISTVTGYCIIYHNRHSECCMTSIGIRNDQCMCGILLLIVLETSARVGGKYQNVGCFYTPVTLVKRDPLSSFYETNVNKAFSSEMNLLVYHNKQVHPKPPWQNLALGQSLKLPPSCMVQYWNGHNFVTKQNRNTNEVSFPANFLIPIQVVTFLRTSISCCKVNININL